MSWNDGDGLDVPFPPTPPPLPSAQELERLLPLMDDGQKAELLELLEARDRAEALRPFDSTPQIRDLLRISYLGEAATKADPEGWLVSKRAHEQRWSFHMARLKAGRPPPRTMRELLDYARFEADSIEAKLLATADGFPDPSVVTDEAKSSE